MSEQHEKHEQHEQNETQDPQVVAPQNAKQNKITKTQQAKKQFKKFVFQMQRGVNDEAARQALRSKGKLPWRVVYNAMGQLFYRVGQQSEYAVLCALRQLRHIVHLFGAGIVLLFVTFIVPIFRFVRALWNDIAEPFVHVSTSGWHLLRAMHEGRKNGKGMVSAGTEYVRNGLRMYRRLLLGAVSYLFPLVALVLFAFTVHQVIGREFSLQVEYNGATIGFVENESVWEKAQTLIRSRIKAADSTEEWNATPVFHVVSVNEAARSSATELADTVMMSSPDTVQKATGLYWNDVLLGVCAETQEVQSLLENALEDAQSAMPAGRAEFVHKLELVSGWYFTSSVGSFDAVEQKLLANDGLSIKTVVTQTYDEPVPFETVEEENENYYEGTSHVSQYGVNGVQNILADFVYIDGVEVERRILGAEITTQPVNKIVQIGTKKRTSDVGQVGSGIMSFPVPGYSYITTLFGQGGHRGVDICGPYGTPIYACDGGVVTEAAYHYSWGNYVKIDHGNGMATLYAHCSQLLVSVGQSVARGEIISLMGSTGTSTGNHLHLEMYVGGSLVNPFNYVSP